MSDPELSVIIPTFGRAAQVVRAIDSALGQDAALEVIVVDDGSPAALTIERARTRVIRLPHNQGAAAARNAGAAAAKADWIAFLDSDDVWMPGSLCRRLDAARGGDATQTIWTSAFAYVWPNGRRRERIPRESAERADYAAGCWSCPGSTALLSREAWMRSGGQDPNLRRLEDYDWLLRWTEAGGQVAVHDSVAAEIRRGGRARASTIEEAAAYLRRKHAALEAPLRKRMESYLALECAAARFHAGDVSAGARSLMRSWLLHPRLQLALEPFWRRRGDPSHSASRP